ncbi:MAG TPA: histidine phosphatase family protein [Candidatus Limnocylindria bacterium]
MTDRRLVVVRHGVTDWNREGRFQGHLDPPLSDAGRHEARLVGERIAVDPGLRPSRIVSSSLGRAMETAAAIGDATGVPVEPDRRLIEIGQGEWEGRTHAELEVSDTDRYRKWREASGIRQPPGGESIASATERVRALLAELLAAAPGTTCLVSHGGTLRILARIVLDLADDRSWALDVDNASVGAATRLGDEWRLDRWNDTRHLLGVELTHVDESEGRPLAL